MANPKNECKLEFSNNLWLPFIDQTHSKIVFFAIFFQIYKNIVTEWKH